MQSFSQAQAQMAKYWHERMMFTYGPVALAAGVTTIFAAANWTPDKAPEWEAAITGLAVTQNAGVQVQMVYDDRYANQGAQGFTDATPAGIHRTELYMPAVRQLQLLVNNATGNPIAGFQLNYEISMRRLTIADKLLYGYGLSPADEQVLKLLDRQETKGLVTGRQQVQDLVERGTSPIAIETQMERTLLNRRLGDHPEGGLLHITAAPTTAGLPFATLRPLNGELLVLEEIAVEGASAITLMVDRDEDLNYLILNGPAYVQTDGQPWRPFIPILRSLNLRAAAVGVLNNVPIRIRVGRYRLSNLWRVRLGLARSAEAVPGDLYAKVWAGLS